MLDDVIKEKLAEFKYDFLINFFSGLDPEIVHKINISCKEKGTFLNLYFVSKNTNNCNFEIGIMLDKEKRINFFIGEFGGALMQYEEVNDLESEQAILAAVLAFLMSSVKEKRKYCGKKMIEVSYLCSEITYPESDTMLQFKPFSKSFLLCLKKRLEEKSFEPWISE